MTFVVPPRARHRHQVDGKYTLKLLESRICINVAWGIWALIDLAETVLGMVMKEYLIGTGKLAKRRCLVCPNDNCYKSDYGGARKSDV